MSPAAAEKSVGLRKAVPDGGSSALTHEQLRNGTMSLFTSFPRIPKTEVLMRMRKKSSRRGKSLQTKKMRRRRKKMKKRMMMMRMILIKMWKRR